jgi:hypothetical protein
MTEVESKLAEALHKILSISLGVYPQAFDGVDRTEWQEGWNAARKAYTKEIIDIVRNEPCVSVAVDITDSLSPKPFESIQPKVLNTRNEK